jgi:hypothetical protein
VTVAVPQPGSPGGLEIPPGLLEEVLEAMPHIFSVSCDNPVGSFFEVIGDTGGHGLCDCAVLELIELLGRGELVWLSLDPEYRAVMHPRRLECQIPSDYPTHYVEDPDEVCQDHAVAYVDGWLIDLTARQFDPKFHFPFFWRP